MALISKDGLKDYRVRRGHGEGNCPSRSRASALVNSFEELQRLVPPDLELYLALNGDTPYCSRIFHTQDGLLAWAEEQRVQNLAEGWS